MTRKDYIVVADIIGEEMQMTGSDDKTLWRLADRFAHWFSKDNPRFNRDRFEERITKTARAKE